ncbi:hypothetical protein [Kitasatospora sp. NPDC059571]|uniref:hypothetical protein n=1 Tax=Kitasatospora sp. NPDC059571 TaxID=3346871 RepID=UPI00367ECD82
MSVHRPSEGRGPGRHRARGGAAPGRAGPRGPAPGPAPGPSRVAPFRQPVALAVPGDEAGFERLRRHRLYGGCDYPGYLRRTEVRLRALRGLGFDVRVRLLEPAAYESFCAARLLVPGDPVAQAAYAADPAWAGAALRYTGGRLAPLLPLLVREHGERLRTAAAREAPPPPPEALRRAARTFLALAAGAGRGQHRAVLVGGAPPGRPVAEAGLDAREPGRLGADAAEAEAFCRALAQVLVGARPAVLLLYSRGAAAPAGERAVVRGWEVRPGGALVPLAPQVLRPQWRRSGPEGFCPAAAGRAFRPPEEPGRPAG